jgi:vacuolar-type H+-ATPase subunit B/Vma2
MAVEDTGGPLKAPVGKGILSRIFDVFGNTIDREAVLSNGDRFIARRRRWHGVPSVIPHPLVTIAYFAIGPNHGIPRSS